MDEWRTHRLGDIVDIFDGPHATPTKSASGPVFLGISNLVAGRLDLTATEHVSEAVFLDWTRRVTPGVGDVVFSYETKLGEAALIPAGFRGCLGRRMGLLRARDGIVDSEFLIYAYLSPRFQDLIRERTVRGSTVDRIPLMEMPSWPIGLPPIREQRAIAGVLKALDDKIELNRRMNETLEGMARALFQSWFVDFDPVRAKAEGRTPAGMDSATAARFPSSFDGFQPTSWSTLPLGEWVTALSGGTPSKGTDAYWGGDIPWISPKAMMEIHAQDSDERVTEAAIGNGTRLAKQRTTLIMVRGMGLHESVRVSQATRDVTFNQDVKALVAGEKLSPTLLFFAMLNAQATLLTKVESSGHGTGKLASEILLGHPITLPPLDIQQRLAEFFDALNARMIANRAETQTLTILRDALLPRLLSGELRVKDAERLIEVAA